jgi:hypothetical protein
MKIFFFFITLSFTSLAYSQGNLQFNQVLTYVQSHTLTSCGSSICSWTGSTYTVPAGKVWKVENFIQSGASPASMLINSVCDVSSINGLPLWLKAGDQIHMRRVCASNPYANCAGGGSFLLSILEFNVVQ